MVVFKTIKYTVIIFLSLIFIASASAAYVFYNQNNEYLDQKADLEKELTDIQKQSLPKDTETEKNTAVSADVDNDVAPCYDLTAEEESIISSWKTYSNSKYGYSIKYPASWTATSTDLDRVSLKSNDTDGASLTFYGGEAAIMGFPEYDLIENLNWTINCADTRVSRFSFETNGRNVITSFTHANTTFVIMYNYVFSGASQESDMVEQAKLIFTTVKFD